MLMCLCASGVFSIQGGDFVIWLFLRACKLLFMFPFAIPKDRRCMLKLFKSETAGTWKKKIYNFHAA